jgi:hypothetical protein
MNTQLIDSLVTIIHSLSPEEQAILGEKLFFDNSYPSSNDIMTLASQGGSFDFLNDEPDLYSLDDGEPISCL